MIVQEGGQVCKKDVPRATGLVKAKIDRKPESQVADRQSLTSIPEVHDRLYGNLLG